MDQRPIRTDEITGIISYLNTIDWTEPWLQVLLGIHTFLLLLTLITYRYNTLQAVMFFCYLAVMFFVENINEWAAKNYRLFSQQQYFDSKGMFISIVFSLPLLVNCLIILVFWMCMMCGIMSRIQVARLKQKAKAQNSNNDNNDVDNHTAPQKEPSKESKKHR